MPHLYGLYIFHGLRSDVFYILCYRFFLPFTSHFKVWGTIFSNSLSRFVITLYQQKKIGIPQQNKLCLLHFSLYESQNIFCEKHGIFIQEKGVVIILSLAYYRNLNCSALIKARLCILDSHTEITVKPGQAFPSLTN